MTQKEVDELSLRHAEIAKQEAAGRVIEKRAQALSELIDEHLAKEAVDGN